MWFRNSNLSGLHVNWDLSNIDLFKCQMSSGPHGPIFFRSNYSGNKCRQLGALLYSLFTFFVGVHADVSCKYNGESEMHPFAFRVHAHSLGK